MLRGRILRRTLLAGAAIAVTANAGMADNLSEAKGNTDSSWLNGGVWDQGKGEIASKFGDDFTVVRVKRGRGALSDWKTSSVKESEAPIDRGMTIAISPMADVGMTDHRVTIAGFVKGDVIYDFNQNLGDSFNAGNITRGGNRQHVRLHARQSRFNVRSRSDTAIGQIRALIEGDFFGSGDSFRLRHAWGEWDMTPQLTFGAGRFWSNFYPLTTGIPTVDFAGPAGLASGKPRTNQMRLTYHAFGSSLAFAIEDPSGKSGDLVGATLAGGNNRARDDIPDMTLRWSYQDDAGNEVGVTGVARSYHFDGSGIAGASDQRAWGWGVSANANVNLGDIALLSAGGMYGKGLGRYLIYVPFGSYYDAARNKIDTVESYGVFTGLSAPLTDTTSVNVGWGWTWSKRAHIRAGANAIGTADSDWTTEVMTVHGNLLWRPVNSLQLGWEVMWADRRYLSSDGAGTVAPGASKSNAWRAQFGAWFFF